MKIWPATVLTLGVITGCILPIPIPHGKVLDGTEVKPKDLAFLEPAVTTRAEVIQQLGQPTIIWRDENTLIYRWLQRKGMVLWAIAGGYNANAGAIDITAEYAFLIKFDKADRFVFSEIVHKSGSKSFGKFLLEWRDAQPTKSRGGKELPP